MYYILAVFRSRTHTKLFEERLRASGVSCSIVQTPAGARVGCGISVRFSRSDLPRARLVLSRFSVSSFAGFYELPYRGSSKALKRII